mmetsp:Transcript_26485/g.89114  ORF Transcript_26485/g.89114 Transcript_26485/m.89114 type:complete len:217 (-) Transcript_26485:1725-2375(-)
MRRHRPERVPQQRHVRLAEPVRLRPRVVRIRLHNSRLLPSLQTPRQLHAARDVHLRARLGGPRLRPTSVRTRMRPRRILRGPGHVQVHAIRVALPHGPRRAQALLPHAFGRRAAHGVDGVRLQRAHLRPGAEIHAQRRPRRKDTKCDAGERRPRRRRHVVRCFKLRRAGRPRVRRPGGCRRCRRAQAEMRCQAEVPFVQRHGHRQRRRVVPARLRL